MATEKQIAANRANALRSTGPKTLAGRLKSSRNAYRHGLSLSMTADLSMIDKVGVVARSMVNDPADRASLEAAKSFVQAQLELLRIRAERKDLAKSIDLASCDFSALGQIGRASCRERV